MKLQHIALDKLKVSTTNVRHARKAPDISDILPSIRIRGVLQPLLVRPDGDTSFEIVAGRRRYFASLRVAYEQGADEEQVKLPCAITEAGDDIAAMEASLIENVAREPMDEIAQYEAFARLIKQGRTIVEIAATFGFTELAVKQRLAIAGLHARIREAYRNGDIEVDDLRLLTTATKRQQKEWIELFDMESDPENDGGEGAPRDRELKHWLHDGEEITTKVALFPLEAYTGTIVTDLFGDTASFADKELFWSLQNAALAKLRDDLRFEGWADVHIMERGQRFHAWEYTETPKEGGGHVYLEVKDTGEVERHEGYIDSEMVHEGEGDDIEVEPNEVDPHDVPLAPQVRFELTKAAENYLSLHRHAIVRAELLAKPAVALRLTVAHMIAGSSLWSVQHEPQRADKDAFAESVGNSRAQAVFERERSAVIDLLGLERAAGNALTGSDRDETFGAAIFSHLLTLTDDAVLRVLTLVMAETLEATSTMNEAAGYVLKPEIASWWSADTTFFDLVRDRAAINAMLRDIAGDEIANANVSEPGKVQKKIMFDCVSGEGRAKREGWVPRYMQFPATSYDGAKMLQITARFASVRDLFSA